MKAEAIRDTARVLAANGIDTAAALRAAAGDGARLKLVRKAWCAVKAQRSGITWRYVLMLAGVPGVKPDRMIIRFVADALEVPRRSVGSEFAAEIVPAAAPELDVRFANGTAATAESPNSGCTYTSTRLSATRS